MAIKNPESGSYDDLMKNVGSKVGVHAAEAEVSFEEKIEATVQKIIQFTALQLEGLSDEEKLLVTNRVGQLIGDIYWEAHKKHVLGLKRK